MPAPAFAPERNPDNQSEGADIAFIAEAMGKPLMPWQRFVADIATEKLPKGKYRFPIVVLTVPRQSGKTTLLGPLQINRVLDNPGMKAFYTAQTGKDARSRFTDLVKLIQESPLDEIFTMRYAAGSEAIQCPNGSSINLFSPTASALHGETPPLVVLDEIWFHTEARGIELMGAIGPAQITIPNRQLWLVSTMGTAQSAFMNDYLKRGLAGEPGVGLFKWSMDPKRDPYDPEAWKFHPALGHTQHMEDLLAESKRQPRGEWIRAFMNLMTETQDAIIPPSEFDSLPSPDAPQRSQVAIGYEVARGGDATSVFAAWRTKTGDPAVALIHRAGGTSWAPAFIRKIASEWRPVGIFADDGGETVSLTAQLKSPSPGTAKPLEVTTLSMREFYGACHQFLKVARDDRTLEHCHSHALRESVLRAVIRHSGDTWRFSRQHSAGHIDALIAAAVALWGYDRRPAPVGKPEIRF